MGSTIREKSQNVTQVIFQNIDGIPRGADGDIKLQVAHHFLVTNTIDIFSLMEMNTS